jgi:AmmeMemoRadiSam system protein B
MEEVNLRKAIVAGQFYPADALQLKNDISGFLDQELKRTEAIACLLPHAGYIYSGKVAAKTVSRINVKDKAILIGPNHSGYGSEYSIMAQGAWQTPLGQVNIDSELAHAIIKESKYFADDDLAHLHEHSLEVEIPLLQYFKSDLEIVPITVFPAKLEVLKEMGLDIARAIIKQKTQNSVLLVASSDMSHYEPFESAEKKDKMAIKAILELDEEKLLQSVKEFNITMCGYAPVIIMLSAIKALGAKKGELIDYRTSAQVNKDYGSVVGYAGIIFN